MPYQSTPWAMYDTISGDILEIGHESWIRETHRYTIQAANGEYPTPVAIGTIVEVERAQRIIRRHSLSRNPQNLSRAKPNYA